MPRLKVELTETEIAERAAEIRARWSEPEHRKRAGIIPQRWLPPEVTPIDADADYLGWLYAGDPI